jgi:hypothetical protein
MKNTLKITSILILALLFFVTAFENVDAKGSFGGSRGSFGGSRGGGFSRSSSRSSGLSHSSSSASRSSFGGSRLSSSANYTSKYGAPRRTVTSNEMTGLGSNYRLNDYGGYSSGLMTGYMLGHTSWLWSMPFHPAFYYSRPYEVVNPDGTIDVYPPTFSYSKLVFTLLVLFAIIYLIRLAFKKRKQRKIEAYSQSSFS